MITNIEKLKEVITGGNYSISDIVKTAYNSYIPQYKNGCVFLNEKTGVIYGASLSPNEQLDANATCIYVIEANTDIPIEELLSDSELDEFKRKEYFSIKEFLIREELQEREINYFEFYLSEQI